MEGDMGPVKLAEYTGGNQFLEILHDFGGRFDRTIPREENRVLRIDFRRLKGYAFCNAILFSVRRSFASQRPARISAPRSKNRKKASTPVIEFSSRHSWSHSGERSPKRLLYFRSGGRNNMEEMRYS
ncbi:MAG: hypothetical protein R6U98_24200 [Pirellulaceae bacterium]